MSMIATKNPEMTLSETDLCIKHLNKWDQLWGAVNEKIKERLLAAHASVPESWVLFESSLTSL